VENFLNELNDQQRLAVEHISGPSLVIAGAGSGKTRVLTTRIAYLIHKGIDPFNILALTFTNKAAREMRDRIQQMVGQEAKNLWMGTFHSVFARILRAEAKKLGYPTNFTIYDTDDSKSLIKTIVKEEELDTKLYKPNYVYNRISSAKNSFIKPKDYLNNEEIMSEDLASGRKKMGELYLKYVARCFKAGAMDFDDLLIKTYDLLNEHPEALLKYQHFFRYLMIDEFQDTNLVQYLIVKKLSASHRNLSVVGDDAQSIYSFRGATIKNILNFERDYPELKVFKLEQNYRSTQNIVNASGNVIEKNKYQLKKKLWTSNEAGNKIRLIRANSEGDEGRIVSNSIVEEKKRLGLKNNDIVILYRTNAQSRPFEEALRRQGLEYRIIGSLSFYQRKEIKDILAYFRFVLNPNDEEALKRIINYPRRGIGGTTLSKIIVWADDNDTSLWEVLSNIHLFPLSPRIANTVKDFVAMIKGFQVIVKSKDAFETATFISKNTGINKLLYEDKTIDGINRYENLQSLMTAIKEFTETPDREDKSLGTFLQEVALLTDADEKKDEGDKITLMTVHAAKGLEFPLVYVAGMEEGLFPSQMSMNSREEVEEERRLFYVAVTRSEKQLYLSYANTRFRFGDMNFCEPSRFLDEIDYKFIEYHNVAEQDLPSNVSVSTKVIPRPKVKVIQKRPRVTKKTSPDFIPSDLTKLQNGMEIEHSKFGMGKVLQLEGQGDSRKATIYFNEGGQKQILLKFAKMRIL
jgi:DNA helicase-2/ATP-dependent DNA helicase PcrA